jgi:hypothetical protein
MRRTLAAFAILGVLSGGGAQAELTAEDVYALTQLSPEGLRARLESDLDPNAMIAGDPLLIRMLAEANSAEDVARIEVLLKAGADPNLPGQFAQTPFLYLLMFGGATKDTERETIEMFLRNGARIDYVADVDLDGDGTPEMAGQLGLASVMAAPANLGAQDRLLVALELGARFQAPSAATFATPFFYAATAADDGTLATAFLDAGAQPCFFPVRYADAEVTMIDGVTRPQSAVWEIQWQGALDWGLKDRLAAHPDVLSDLMTSRGVCPENKD